jgi:hypothetical protein
MVDDRAVLTQSAAVGAWHSESGGDITFDADGSFTVTDLLNAVLIPIIVRASGALVPESGDLNQHWRRSVWTVKYRPSSVYDGAWLLAGIRDARTC